MVGRSLRLPAGVGPMVMTPNGRILYVADYYDGVVFAVRTATNVIAKRINMGFPSSLVVSPDGKTVYAAAGDVTTGACEVIPIVVATNTARPPILVPSCASLDAVAITPSGRKLYVADYSFNRVFPIDTASGAVDQPITVGPYPEALAVTRDGSRLYVVNSDAG
jgi:YVTN family beta-propeller protein